MFPLSQYSNVRQLQNDLANYFKKRFSFADSIKVYCDQKNVILDLRFTFNGKGALALGKGETFTIYTNKLAFHLLEKLNIGNTVFYPACGNDFTPLFAFPQCRTFIYQDDAPQVLPIMSRPRKDYFAIFRSLQDNDVISDLITKRAKEGKTVFSFKLLNPIDDIFYKKTLILYDRPLGDIYATTPGELENVTLFYASFFINFLVHIVNVGKVDMRFHQKEVDFFWKIFSSMKIGSVYDFCIPLYLTESMRFERVKKKFSDLGLTKINKKRQIYRKVKNVTHNQFVEVMNRVEK